MPGRGRRVAGGAVPARGPPVHRADASRTRRPPPGVADGSALDRCAVAR
ncbi:MAG: hypothetical protein AVDCRST_MAG49-676 [uncultured Thermomicrobiales bacterium]|uniref:Uncharacterized protein n=1 Tax=uncultured Thermomicrobiales bacterium TaxID=1645740 RepID=A0A6J4U694_9BACT|nr:MAG: hypothetical protein AVDCRST_MAG49-676 [uncultured Thermomicrobiales bacterium]